MFDELNIYKRRGHFLFKKGDILKKVCNAPEEPGVYIINRLLHENIDIVYIGKSGTIKQDGSFKDQLLCSRINKKQDGVYRQQFFDKKLEEEQIDALDIYWYVTFDDKQKHLPAYVEGILFQLFFELHGQLPQWNKHA